MELRVNFNFLISKWQPGRDGANNGGSVLCSHPTSEVGQHPGPAGKQAGMPLPRIPLGIPAPLLPKDTFLSSSGNGLEPAVSSRKSRLKITLEFFF